MIIPYPPSDLINIAEFIIKKLGLKAVSMDNLGIEKALIYLFFVG